MTDRIHKTLDNLIIFKTVKLKKTAISFDNILSFEKATGSKQMQGPVCQSSIVTNDEASNNITMIPSNIHENSSTYPYPSPSTESGNC